MKNKTNLKKQSQMTYKTGTKFSFIVSLLVIFLTALTGCEENQNQSEEMHTAPAEEHTIHLSQEQFDANEMRLGTVTEKNFAEFIHTSGMIGVPPKYQASVSTLFGGYVNGLNLINGDYVRKGQILFTLENPEFVKMQQRYLQLKEQTAYLKTEYERQKKLYEEQIASTKSFLKTQAEYKTAYAEKSALAKQLRMIGIQPGNITPENITSRIRIQAPISGYVASINLTKGQYIEPEHIAMEIINTEHKHVEIKVFEKDIHKIKKGQTFVFNLPNQPEVQYKGTVFLIGKKVDPEKRFINVHGHIEDEKKAGTLLPEMFTDIKIIYKNFTAPALPETAVLSDGENHFVLRKTGNEGEEILFEKVPVQTGAHYEGYVAVLSPKFEKTDTLLIKGGYFLIGVEEGGHDH